MRKALLALGVVCTALSASAFAQQPSDTQPLKLGVPSLNAKIEEADPLDAIIEILNQLQARLLALEAKAAPRRADWIGGAQDPFAATAPIRREHVRRPRDRQVSDPFAPATTAMQPTPPAAAFPPARTVLAPKATKWEYKSASAEIGIANKLGAEGWELVAVAHQPQLGAVTAYFKRPLGTDQAQQVIAPPTPYNPASN